jgi:hypothetical protein
MEMCHFDREFFSMKKSIVLCALAISATFLSFEASALTLNGKTYKQVSSTTKVCLDKSKPITYSGKKYCHTYKANIGWTAPVKRVNGSALPVGEISSYEVYWTRSIDTRSGVIKVKAASLATALEVFTPDTYHFAISAVDIKGLKSPLSKVVSARLD